MRMNKPPMSREQAKQGDLIPAGTYPFEVVDASDEISKKGHDMIKLKLKIYLEDGRERILFDYLLEALEYKLAHFFEAIGKWEKYESGEFSADDCFGSSGEVKIYIQKDKDGQYGDKSAVQDYILTDGQQASKDARKEKHAKVEDYIDDDVPF